MIVDTEVDDLQVKQEEDEEAVMQNTAKERSLPERDKANSMSTQITFGQFSTSNPFTFEDK